MMNTDEDLWLDRMTQHCETRSITKYPMVGRIVTVISFSTWELGFYHFRMPVTIHKIILETLKSRLR